VTVTVDSIEYFNSPVTLSVVSPPPGVTASFSTNPVTPPFNSSASSTLTVTLGPTVTPGTYSPSVSGTSSQLTHAVPASVVVTVTSSGMTNVVSAFATDGSITSGIDNALNAKLAAVQSDINSGDNRSAFNVLSAFINQVRAQSGKHITTSAASALIMDAQSLQATLK